MAILSPKNVKSELRHPEWSKHGKFVMFTNNLNGLAWVHLKALMPVLTNSNIYFGGEKKVS